ncbi:MAG: transcription-repair coupling factor [Bdellovibrionaceae bacterium]|nr:transcription-repair coupling factor [Pseudobdellovibrionaceae bacterium]
MKVENLCSRAEQIIERRLSLGQQDLRLVGSTSPTLLALIVTGAGDTTLGRLPHLVIAPNETFLPSLSQAIKAFDPSRAIYTLPAFDVSPFSGLYPAPHVASRRLFFLKHMLDATPRDIFLTTPVALCQNTLPREIFARFDQTLRVGDSLPNDFASFLVSAGYSAAPTVEEVGQFSTRGGILDVYSPGHELPVRIELFGDIINSMRFFSPSEQRSLETTDVLNIIPAKEILFLEEESPQILSRYLKTLEGQKNPPKEVTDNIIRSIRQEQFFSGAEFLVQAFYSRPGCIADYITKDFCIWIINEEEIARELSHFFSDLAEERASSPGLAICPDANLLYQQDISPFLSKKPKISLHDILEVDLDNTSENKVEYRTYLPSDFINPLNAAGIGSEEWVSLLGAKIKDYRLSGYTAIISAPHPSSRERLAFALKSNGLYPIIPSEDSYEWATWVSQQESNSSYVHLIPHNLPESVRLPEERLIILTETSLLGKKTSARTRSSYRDFQKSAEFLAFGDLSPGDYVVHSFHGIGKYDGLIKMAVGGATSEFIQISYRDRDRLYLPVYRVGQLQKYTGNPNSVQLDKLGGSSWEKTKSKTKKHLREIAADLLTLYAERSQIARKPIVTPADLMQKFESLFPYEETEDQLRALEEIRADLSKTTPMDRLICGDVGFGKTEVAMRAAFMVASTGKQVAVLAPTTVLTLQHLETFRRRFNGFNFNIHALNRFVSPNETKKILTGLQDGSVNIVIGTHRLLSKDVQFKDLGLLIVDEEHRFGVVHKEKLRKLRSSVDTLALSATPIPRTLNMSLVGVRDLSLINTPPADRQPTRTFICLYEKEVINKAVRAEISRGGQVFFIHNRIQTIYGVADELRQMLPDVRIRVAHGQMSENELEETMLGFFRHEFDLLVCTAIVESGMDIPNANTMFINDADHFGLSQLYQLRGRVGRSKQKAYCYLMVPRSRKLTKEAHERLKVIQDNTALGSGIKIAHYDLELRGAGSILGEEQSGHIDAVGYEMYLELLKETLAEIKGEPPPKKPIEPEINLRIPAFIPEDYVSDIRLRLSYYKALAQIESDADLEKIEDELRDRFGPLPQEAINLMGLMLIRKECRDLGVRDVSAGSKNISLIFTPQTPISTETIVHLATKESGKYSLTPDNRLNIRMSEMSWSNVYSEIRHLKSLI